jgi:hypothetical protein
MAICGQLLYREQGQDRPPQLECREILIVNDE